MNKYQKQALKDMGKVAIAFAAVVVIFNGLIMLGATAADLVGGLSLVVMIYCIYQLFLIRVGQLESEDKETK